MKSDKFVFFMIRISFCINTFYKKLNFLCDDVSNFLLAVLFFIFASQVKQSKHKHKMCIEHGIKLANCKINRKFLSITLNRKASRRDVHCTEYITVTGAKERFIQHI